ncbi:Hypothetical predicted protein, partial [Pelobates cultripes]
EFLDSKIGDEVDSEMNSEIEPQRVCVAGRMTRQLESSDTLLNPLHSLLPK